MKKFLVPFACCWLLFALFAYDALLSKENSVSLADIFQLSKPVKNFMSALIVDPSLGCHYNCDRKVRKADRLFREQKGLEDKKEDLIKNLKAERDKLEQKVFEASIGLHRDQLARAIEVAKSNLQLNADIAEKIAERKVILDIHCTQSNCFDSACITEARN